MDRLKQAAVDNKKLLCCESNVYPTSFYAIDEYIAALEANQQAPKKLVKKAKKVKK